jgi:hypothetical protein
MDQFSQALFSMSWKGRVNTFAMVREWNMVLGLGGLGPYRLLISFSRISFCGHDNSTDISRGSCHATEILQRTLQRDYW